MQQLRPDAPDSVTRQRRSAETPRSIPDDEDTDEAARQINPPIVIDESPDDSISPMTTSPVAQLSVKIDWPDPNNSEKVSQSTYQWHASPHYTANTQYSRRPTSSSVTEDIINNAIQYFASKDSSYPPSYPNHPIVPRWIMLALSLFAFLLVSLSALCFLHLHAIVDGSHCHMPYMSPSYMELTAFNSTRLASKYSIHLYRESGVDSDTLDSVTGVPVIFIPGNAGSFRQVRSLASECSYQYQAMTEKNTDDSAIGHLDFFTADFGEDLTAFHGQTLLDQAEYLNDAIAFILEMYRESAVSKGQPLASVPRSVILVGHSMGGMVARTMFLLPNYIQGSVVNIMTLATPHSLPPVAFDKDLVQLYERTNKYWEKSYSEELMGSNPLAHISLISIAGGKLDKMIPPEHTSVNSLVPDSNGFTVFTSTVPNVWVGADHQAIVWCDQLRKALATTFLRITDIRNPSRLTSLPQRMGTFRQMLLSGLEECPQYSKHQGSVTGNSHTPLPFNTFDTILVGGHHTGKIMSEDQQLRLTPVSPSFPGPRMYLFPVLPNMNNTEFNLITNRRVIENEAGNDEKESLTLVDQFLGIRNDKDEKDGLYILACRLRFTGAHERPIALKSDPTTLDIRPTSISGGRWAKMMCRNGANDVVRLPQAAHIKETFPDMRSNVSYLHYDMKDLSYYDYVVVVDHTKVPVHGGFTIAGVDSHEKTHINVKQNLWRILLGRPLIAKIRGDGPSMIDISFDNVWSSLLSFKGEWVAVRTKKPNSSHVPLFSPIVRQYVEELHESRFSINVGPGTSTKIAVHGVAPFSPFRLNRDNEKYNNLHFQMWSDARQAMNLKLQLDYPTTIARIVLHYRVVVAVFPLIVVFLVAMIQFQIHAATGRFISFDTGFKMYIRYYLPWLLLATCVLPYALNKSSVINLLYFIEPSLDGTLGEGLTSIFADRKKNDFFLGLESDHMWFLGPVFILMVSGVCYICYVTIDAIIMGVVNMIPASLDDGSLSMETNERNTSKRRVVLILLCAAVAFFVPYQFALLTFCMVLLLLAIKNAYRLEMVRRLKEKAEKQEEITSEKQEESRVEKQEENRLEKSVTENSTDTLFKLNNLYNYGESILMLVFWTLPANVPVLMVWAHNISVRWTMAFHSHHNLLSIIPIMLVVERIAAGKMIPRMQRFSQQIFTRLMLVYSVVYTLIFGLQRAYWLHHLVNCFAAWLVVAYFGRE